MSDNKLGALTPIIVGVVIALIGILTGLYIADNAREQLTTVHSAEAEVNVTPEITTSQEPYTSQSSYPDDMVDSLPPLEPIVVDNVLPEIEDEKQESEPLEVSEEQQSDEQSPVEVEDVNEVSSEDINTSDIEETEE